MWYALEDSINSCLGDTLWHLIDAKKLENRDDTKLIILPPSNLGATPDEFSKCTHVTLGIGGDIEAELLLRKLQPHCRFYGADPIKKSGNLYRELGTYHELAVASVGGTFSANVLENGVYGLKNVTVISFVDFLTNYINETKIDYLFMDNEDAEYKIFDQLARGIFEMNKISLCQISVEMHKWWPEGVNQTTFHEMMSILITNSSFIPIWSNYFGHLRSFYVNVDDPYCVGKYFRSKWCKDFRDYKKISVTFN